MYLITGGGGFIGSHLVRAVLEQGHPVRVLDDFSTGFEANLAAVGDDVEVIRGDLRDAAAVDRAVRGAEVVLHLAALGSVPRSLADPAASLAVNTTGTLNVLTAARDHGVRRVVQASSSSVYGDTPTLPKTVAMRPQPRSPYAVSKLAAEAMGVAFHHSYGLETVALRYFNVFGPRQNPHSEYSAVIPRFVAAVGSGRPVTIFGDGEQSRDFTYVENVVRANLLAVASPTAPGQVLNIAAGESVSVNAMLRAVCDRLGREAVVDFAPPRTGDVRDSLADLGPAEQVLGYRPTVDFGTGLDRTVASMTVPAAP